MASAPNSDLRSFIEVSSDSHFPIQNLPYGAFGRAAPDDAAIGVAIGESILDVTALEQRGLLEVPGGDGRVFADGTLNAFLALGRSAWTPVRQRLTQLLRHDEPTLRDDSDLRQAVLVRQADVEMRMPVAIGDYTDYYSSRYHATNVGTIMRGADNALQENWLHLPVAYHGRASSVVLSGTDIPRPSGQTGPGKFGPCKAFDYELEMGFFVGPGSDSGQPIPIGKADEHIFGMALVNDWSARDIQKWEYVPLGPFLAKNFATSIAPWIVTLDALAPFRSDSPQQDPAPLPYLTRADDYTFDIELEVSLSPEDQAPETITRTNFHHLYWTISQQLAHHTVTGCNMRPGDLLASGTISGPEKESRGCMLELSWRGSEPIELASGATRTFMQDNDRITMTGWCQGDGYRVGFGEVTGKLLPAVEV